MVRIARRAEKDLGDLPDPLEHKARELMGRLDAQPALGKKLLGALQGRRSIALGRSYRIIYRVEDSGVMVLAVRQRKDCYK